MHLSCTQREREEHSELRVPATQLCQQCSKSWDWLPPDPGARPPFLSLGTTPHPFPTEEFMRGCRRPTGVITGTMAFYL